MTNDQSVQSNFINYHTKRGTAANLAQLLLKQTQKLEFPQGTNSLQKYFLVSKMNGLHK